MQIQQIEELLGELRTYGYVVLENVFGPVLRDRLVAVTNHLLDRERPLPGNHFEGYDNRKVLNLLAKNRIFEDLPVNPEVLGLVERFLGRGLLLSSISSLYVAPGEDAQPLHSDDQAIRVARHPDFPTVCTTVWALDDMTELNGTTTIVPRSHLLPERLRWTDSAGRAGSRPIQVPQGSVLVFDGACHHGAGANRSAAVRKALTVSYCAGFIRPVENLHLGVPLTVTASFSPRLLDLCGFVPYEGIHGHVDRCAPLDALALETSRDQGS
ncbi:MULTISPECIES: phytanoyl-CoA dioxygenase family protein [Candidatus Microthrix]|uniref:Phytanoyl-CoA dioxygenase n=1 Tax=Candidatus Neomicrothrix parvicella RN1 TaxID=1229780 RepID=R4Z2B4_9ACTN|nr:MULTISPECIES: phytanoyl-CoA dioxygenase family protein [Microthrix]CCM64853.1 conserved hypothetical protein [Candidatus Microthrix parvicella RN1]HMS49455.1 phytanoyl-CoA dioxygenase family protein [Candidatus Microthrix sp.]